MDTKQPEALRLAHIFEHPLPPEWSDMVAATKELRRQHTEIETLRAGYSAARLEIASLHTQMEAVGAGGMEPLRKRCLHQISEPANAGWCDGCSPDNCSGCATPAAPVDADVQKQDEALIWLMLAALQYHTEQTRPIRRTDDAITAARRRLVARIHRQDVARSPRRSKTRRISDAFQGAIQ